MKVLLGVFAASAAAWWWAVTVRQRYGAHINRRHVTGGEMARLLLDQAGFASVAVEPMPAVSEAKNVCLPGSVYTQKTLWALARASREAVLWMRYPQAAIPPELMLSRPLAGWILVGLLWLGLIFQGLTGVWPWGGIWSSVFLAAWLVRVVTRVHLEWDLGREAMGLIKKAGCLELDERVRLKMIFRSLRTEVIAEPLSFPWNFLCQAGVRWKRRGERIVKP